MSKNIKNKLPIHFPIYIIASILTVLTSCVFSPLYMQVGNDVTYMYTALPIIFNYAILLFETMYIALLFSAVAYSAYAVNKDSEKKLPNMVYPILIVFLKHALNLLVSSVIDGYIDISFDLPVTLMLMIADILILLIVWIIADRKSKQYFIRVNKLIKASKYLNTAEYDSSLEIYPFSSVINFKHPILASIFVGALIATASMIVQRAYADIFVLGAPGSFFEIAEIIIAYLIDIILGIVCYATSYFAASYILLREEKQV